MTVDTKIKCTCGCGKVLYISVESYNDLVIIGSEENGRKSFEKFDGVCIGKKELIKLLKDK